MCAGNRFGGDKTDLLHVGHEGVERAQDAPLEVRGREVVEAVGQRGLQHKADHCAGHPGPTEAAQLAQEERGGGARSLRSSSSSGGGGFLLLRERVERDHLEEVL